MFKLLMSSDNILRKDACWTLANLCSHECIIANVLNSQVMGRLFDLLEYENRIEIKREIVQIFNYIVCYGDK